MSDKKRGLGRGLNDLLSSSDWLKRNDIQLFYCPLDRLLPNPYQPRQIIQDAQMEELVRSIREKGVLQPILAVKTDTPDQYQILAGERRWRASREAGLTEVPVILRDTAPSEVLELALIENIQRQDLTCIEEALAYQRLQEEFHLSQEEIAGRVGKSRSTVTNLLRLLQLPADIQARVLNQEISMGHARALLSLPTPEEQRRICAFIVARQLSVRQTEQLVAQRSAEPSPRATADPSWLHLQKALQSHFGASVVLRRKGERGTITIPFGSEDELQRLIERFGLPVGSEEDQP